MDRSDYQLIGTINRLLLLLINSLLLLLLMLVLRADERAKIACIGNRSTDCSSSIRCFAAAAAAISVYY